MKTYEQIASRLDSLNVDEIDDSIKIDIEGDQNNLDGILLVLTIPYQSFLDDENGFKIISISNGFEHAEILDGEDSYEEFDSMEIQEKVRNFIEMRRDEDENSNIQIIVSNEAHGINKLTPVFNVSGCLEVMSRQDIRQLSNSKWLGKNAISIFSNSIQLHRFRWIINILNQFMISFKYFPNNIFIIFS